MLFILQVCNKDGQTALMYAFKYGYIEGFKWLLAAGCPFEQNVSVETFKHALKDGHIGMATCMVVIGRGLPGKELF